MMEGLARRLDDLVPLAQSNGCQVYQAANETGEGTMTIYQVFPGVTLMYNDFHMSAFDSHFQSNMDLFCVDYCREGRLEYTVGEDAFSYVEAGDLKLDRRLKHQGHFDFPLSHYHGVTIGFCLPAAAETTRLLGDYPIDLRALQQKYCSGPYPRVIHGAPSIAHIFQELYAVPERIRIPYFRVKVMELLLYLDALEPGNETERPYFYRSQVEAVKAARTYLTEHMDRHITLEELSKRFQLPPTTLKACFKTVFGSPVNTYMRGYRMDRAAMFLRQEPETSVTEIAGRVGYDSASKFAAAFKAVKGKTPQEYRKE